MVHRFGHRESPDAVLPGEERDQLILAEEALPNKDCAELFLRSALLGEGFPEVALGDQPALGEEFAESSP